MVRFAPAKLQAVAFPLFIASPPSGSYAFFRDWIVERVCAPRVFIAKDLSPGKPHPLRRFF
jgi:hypothetical protein